MVGFCSFCPWDVAFLGFWGSVGKPAVLRAFLFEMVEISAQFLSFLIPNKTLPTAGITSLGFLSLQAVSP